MSYLDVLLETKNDIEVDKPLEDNQKFILIEMIEKERIQILIDNEPFQYFYGDVTSLEDIFNFQGILGDQYAIAVEHAQFCLSTFASLSLLKPNIFLYHWLSSAIKVVNCIVMHYLQEVLGESPELQGDAGKERSMFIQINKQGVTAQKAGRIIDNLFDCRNEMEHPLKNDPNKPGNKIFKTPNYKRIQKQIQKRFPDALICFDLAYKDHYAS
jgi:hypothetical protein